MFIEFFLFLRANKFKVSLSEYLNLLEALQLNVIEFSVDDFYSVSKAIFVKNEQFLDRYDVLFGQFFQNRTNLKIEILQAISEDWLKNALAREFTDEEKNQIEEQGGLDALLKRFEELLLEQKERHQGGNKWIGTGGTSKFGNNGQNNEGFKIGGDPKQAGNKTATKVWEKRDFRNYDDDIELNTRNIKMALRKLRILTREGIEDELDLDGTIQDTSRNGGMLDIKLRAQRKNKVKLLLLLDVGGSMDEHIELCSQLFSAAKYQFKHIEHLYFHNFIYENLWKDNSRRNEKISTWEVLHKYNQDYKVVIVGDASMSPYEITHARGSIEHYNEEAGLVWLDRISAHFKHIVWLNPISSGYWQYTPSIKLARTWTENRMFPLTINGLGTAMKSLKNSKIKFEDN
jgi:uncharacterized protein with von Willebrand factor type A (vWA) domain